MPAFVVCPRMPAPPGRIVLIAAAALVALAVAAPAADAAPAKKRPTVSPPTAKISWRAELFAPVVGRRAPRHNARVASRISPTTALGGDRTVLLVTGSKTMHEKLWVRVLLAKRPNGRTAWIPAAAVRLRRNAMRIVIDRQGRRLSVFRRGKRIMRSRVVIGTRAHPTPRGRHAIASRIRTNADGSYLGPWVLPLTAYSEKLNYFAGGNGRVAIHGTNSPELLGGAHSHGCVRMRNRDIVRLSRLAPPGTPVVVR